jgi:hypothetical protein
MSVDQHVQQVPGRGDRQVRREVTSTAQLEPLGSSGRNCGSDNASSSSTSRRRSWVWPRQGALSSPASPGRSSCATPAKVGE